MNTVLKSAQKEIQSLREDAALIEDAINNKDLMRWLKETVEYYKTEFPSWQLNEIDPMITVDNHSSCVSIRFKESYSSFPVAIEDMLKRKDAKLTYNNRALLVEIKEKLLFTNNELELKFSAELTEEEREFLSAHNKLKADIAASNAMVDKLSAATNDMPF